MLSVCMATYNGAKYIKEQIDSILSQLGKEDELIISDDGSTDETCGIIESYHDSRILLLHNEGRHGFVWNFENALRHAKGGYIFLSDQDDIWKPDKVKVVLQYLTTYQLVIHDAELIDSEGRTLGTNYYSKVHHHTDFWCNLWKTRCLGCCMAFHKEVLDYSLPFPKKTVGHDYWIGMLGMTKFSHCFMPEQLLFYRRHGNNTSSSGEKSNNSLFFMLFNKRGYLLKEILKRRLLK